MNITASPSTAMVTVVISNMFARLETSINESSQVTKVK